MPAHRDPPLQHMLGDPALLDRDAVVATVLACQRPDGGFAGHMDYDAHVVYTYRLVRDGTVRAWPSDGGGAQPCCLH